ncbi:MAG: hypothetical protein ACPIOQ_50975 [Promethearchaeia archaeon]
MTDEQEAPAPAPAELPEAQEEVPAPVDGEPGAEDAAAQAADDDASLAEVRPRRVLPTCHCSRTRGGRSRTLSACFSAAIRACLTVAALRLSHRPRMQAQRPQRPQAAPPWTV